MLKKCLAMIVIGSLVAGSSFATPSYIKKMFLKDQTMKSTLVSSHSGKNSTFSGIWAGKCSYADRTDDIKIKIEEDRNEFIVVNLLNEEDVEDYFFNVFKSESYSSKDAYDNFSSRMTRINDHTLKLEGTGVFGSQLPADKDKGLLSGVFTSLYTINNNQLVIDTTGKLSDNSNTGDIQMKCTLNKA